MGGEVEGSEGGEGSEAVRAGAVERAAMTGFMDGGTAAAPAAPMHAATLRR